MPKVKMLFALAVLAIAATTSCNKAALSQQQTQANNKNSVNTVNSGPTQQSATAQQQNTPEEATRILLQEAKAAYDAGNVVIVDTRDANAYKAEHIKGAINIPSAEFENRYKELPKDKQIIAYCS